MSSLLCNFCKTSLKTTFIDLGMSPLVSSYLKTDNLQQMEPFFPLHAYVCDECYLVQLPEAVTPENLFSDYPYFSSYSKSWLQHTRDYVEYVRERFGLDTSSQVVEIASNDGYLLQYFKEKGVSVLGVEPAKNVAETAQAAGIPTIVKFFGIQTAKEIIAEGKQADLIVGNNVLAHVPDLNDFVGGMKSLLKPHGIITMEFPHLKTLIDSNQFDQIFHEHFSYLSFITVKKVFAEHGLTLFDVEELPTHGGSLRIFARHTNDGDNATTEHVQELEDRELQAGFNKVETYASFAQKANATKHKLLEFLIRTKLEGHTIVGYGAPGKGSVLLNYCGIRSDFLDYTVDLSPHKQGLFMPGVHVPIHHPDKIKETKPDYVLLLPHNLKDEIMEQMSYIREWGGQFIVPIPEVKVYS